ncbi:alpha/beta-hydrolase [Sistotremastrum suecicum HHB10207 ss-3]|uniref:Carboxypeptidase n=1 Tax=Sistotremastrum suecicum HHB10207 ss-3 TaxID=1314776 RepID=A0A166HPK3_9AGAM|nr:alpha/beta-hydrolase [Sistotremastrum suecicum HHB10207 ss-3]
MPPSRLGIFSSFPFLFTLCLLILSSHAAPPKASFYIPSLPDLPIDPAKPLHMYGGHISSDPHAATAPEDQITPHIYFFMLKARRLADRERIVFWFNGGPGCSSFDGLLMEAGPFRIDGKGGLKVTEGGWDEYTTMVFLDQPVGTGLSYTSTDNYVHELDEAAAQVVQFLRNFYEIFPEYKAMDTYLAGESYAGQYIPYIAKAILDSNVPTPLKGVAIGNGWIDAMSQYPAYVEYAAKYGIIKEGSEEHTGALESLDTCLNLLNQTQGLVPVSNVYCESLMGSLLSGLYKEIGGKKVCMNVYDVRLSDEYPACGMNWPPDLKDVTKYLRRPDVVMALHAGDKSEAWQECNGRVGGELTNRHSTSAITLLPDLLEHINILLFSGDQDFICNYIGTENLVNSLEWNGAVGLGSSAETLPWAVDGIDAGTWITSRNLTYVKVFNASHMVPYDVPHIAHDMMLRFMGVDFSQIASGSAKIPSNVGNDTKPALIPTTEEEAQETPVSSGNSPEQDKAMWEAYYNAGSAALTLVIIALLIGLFFFCRSRRRRLQSNSPRRYDPEETIPLSQNLASANGSRMGGLDDDDESRRRKGKSRGTEPAQAVFDVGNSDGEEDYKDLRRS